MGKNFLLDSHVLEDPIVLDGISAVGCLEQLLGRPVLICGGMAVSSYLPEETHRHTVDLDFSILWGGTTDQFWKLTEPIVGVLHEKGYAVHKHKQKQTFDIPYSGHSSRFMLQHQRRSTAYFERRRRSFEREIANRRHVVKSDLGYDVESPEDLMVRKLARILKFARQYDLAFPEIRGLDEMKAHIEEEKKQIIALPNVPERDIIRLRMNHDLYDIARLGNYTGANMRYLKEVLTDWTDSPTAYIDTLNRIWGKSVGK